MWINRAEYLKLLCDFASVTARLAEADKHIGWLCSNEARMKREHAAERARAEAAVDNLIQLATQGTAAPIAEKAQKEPIQFDLFDEDPKAVEKDLERIQGGSIDFLDLYEEAAS